MDNKEIKRQAKQLIKTYKYSALLNYMSFFFIVVIAGIVGMFFLPANKWVPGTIDSWVIPVANAIQIVAIIFQVVVIPVLIFGLVYSHIGIARNCPIEGKYLFSGFNDIIRILAISYTMYLIIFIGLIFVIIPGIMFFYQFFMTFFIYTDDEDLNPIEVLKQSSKMMKNEKMKLFKFHLSFFGWLVLTLATFGLASIYTVPYFLISNALYYDRNLKYKLTETK